MLLGYDCYQLVGLRAVSATSAVQGRERLLRKQCSKLNEETWFQKYTARNLFMFSRLIKVEIVSLSRKYVLAHFLKHVV